jgi:hypothetical protein
MGMCGSMRMGTRRFTRLTNAFSKKVENLAAAVSLHYMYYNFARPHQTLTKQANGLQDVARNGGGHRTAYLDAHRHRRAARLSHSVHTIAPKERHRALRARPSVLWLQTHTLHRR